MKARRNEKQEEGKVLFVTRTKLEPITCLYTGELISTADALKQELTKRDEFDEESIDEFLKLFTVVWRKQEEESPFDEDEKRYYVQKYTSGIHPAEAILLGGTKPMFLQIIDGQAKLSVANVDISNVHGLFHTLGIPVSGGLALGFFAGFVRTH